MDRKILKKLVQEAIDSILVLHSVVDYQVFSAEAKWPDVMLGLIDIIDPNKITQEILDDLYTMIVMPMKHIFDAYLIELKEYDIEVPRATIEVMKLLEGKEDSITIKLKLIEEINKIAELHNKVSKEEIQTINT